MNLGLIHVDLSHRILKEMILRKGSLQKKKKKKVWNFPYRGGGGLTDKIPYFLKLCLKSISGHSESFW